MKHPNVPDAAYPVWWDMAKHTAENVKEMERWIAYYSEHMPPDTVVDEVAVLIGPTLIRRVRHILVTEGWKEFNNAEDVVYTNPFGTRYSVEYNFFRHPAVPWRLEVMRLQGGFSPLHEALMAVEWPLGKFPVPHLSFKPVRRKVALPALVYAEAGRPNPGPQLQTWRQAYSGAVQYIRDRAGIHAQTCQSTYGAFGYFLGNDCARQIYLKPRINLRDEGGEAARVYGTMSPNSSVVRAACGELYPCGHAPDGGSHPEVGR